MVCSALRGLFVDRNELKKVSPGVINLINPGPYLPLHLWGPHVILVGAGRKRTAPCQG
jgi:hypothetical protein